MAKRIILAVAGAGKTYYICHAIDPLQRNLVLAFTNENVFNIQRELCDAFGHIPELTTVSTFDSFVYHSLILPYEPSIAQHFNRHDFISNGITTVNPLPQRIQNSQGNMVPNFRYQSKDKLSHYVNNHGQYYCANLSELALQVGNGKESLVQRAINRLNLFFDAVFIDEFQDFRKHDYDLIIRLAKRLSDVTLVGDYYQHSVSGVNNSGKPYQKKKTEVGYSDFVAEIKREGFEVDESSLNESRRCSENVCQFVQNKLGINIASSREHEGSIIWVDKDINRILADNSIMKLVFNNADKYSFRAMNWSYSKGDTVDKACVVLTENLEELDCNDFSLEKMSRLTINKLYVALTRSCGDLYLMKASIFKKNSYPNSTL